MSGSRQILTPRKRILRTLPSEIAVVAQQEGPLRRKVEIRHCNNGGRVRVRKQLGRVAQLFRRDKRCRRVNTGENIELAITRTILEKNFRQDIGTRCMVIAIIFAAKERHARAIFLSDLRDLLIVGRYHHFVEKPALERRLDRICDDGLTAKLFDVLARYALRTAASRDNGDATHSETPPRHTIEPHPRDSL